MSKSQKLFSKKFSQLACLYAEVKSYVLSAEELYDKFPVALVNELRNSYDHIFRIFNNDKFEDTTEIESEIENASRHLKRCGYDALEFLINAYIQKCHKILLSYKKVVLYEVLGDQYHKTKDFLLNSDDRLAKSREEKNSKIAGYYDAQGNASSEDEPLLIQYIDEVPGEEYNTYYPEFKELIRDVKSHYDIVRKRIKDLDEYELELKSNEKKKRNSNIILSLVFFILGIIVSLVLFYFEVFHFGG
ncbi:MAG: hypothetical protein MI975_08075 [Cytophagales bacterium]|nr:hypothetical protein [Cytophagales bacterium]